MISNSIRSVVSLCLFFAASACGASPTSAPLQFGREVLPGVMVLTGYDLKPFQTSFNYPELADPYVTLLQNSAIISGTAQYFLKFASLDDIQRGGPYQIVWNDYFDTDGTPMAGDRNYAHSWDLKPTLWSAAPQDGPRLWDPAQDAQSPLTVWYGGHMRTPAGAKFSSWPQDNFSRDVFAFTEKQPGKWFSFADSVFSQLGDWIRAAGNYVGHRYGHQIAMVPSGAAMPAGGRRIASVFYEDVTEARPDGSPQTTRIFADEMISPYQARGKPAELISPYNPTTGKPFPSALREDGSALTEGPLYFRFYFEGEEWEAFGFSAGSFYGKYPACFAARKVSEGLAGMPYRPDLEDDGSDFHNAGAELGRALHLIGGPGRPAVIVGADGAAIPGATGSLQVLVHGYRQDILPDNDYSRPPSKYRLDQMFRIMIHALLKIEKRNGTLRFDIVVPQGQKPNWG